MAKRARALDFKRALGHVTAEHEGEALLTLPRALGLVALILLTTLLLVYLWQGWQMSYLTGQLARSRAELELLEAKKEMLLLEVARAFSLERIEGIAKNRLGMVEPEIKYLTLPLADEAKRK